MRKLRQKEVETVFRAPAFYTEIYRPPRKMETHVKYPEYSRKKLLKKKIRVPFKGEDWTV